MRAFYRTLRILSAITLFFFCWTFLPLYAAVAYAAAPEGQKSAASSQKSGVQQSTATSADRFEKALESIRENVGKAGAKADKGEDNSKELETLKAKRAAIESADSDFKKEFAATEKKLKDANLPKEILDRHSKFVKNYEDNLTLLKTNLDDVEMSKADSRNLSAALTKAKAHLEKVKAPSRHQKLDPNNLPNRIVKAKARAPRLKKEDFERDFPKQKSQTKYKVADGRTLHDLLATIPKQKPILLAFNETASDVPFQLPHRSRRGLGRGGNTALAFADSSPFLLAQATDQPTADDLSETPDIQFTDAIRAQAQELGGKPVNIYNWVRNNIEYAPTYGSIQGADMCLQSKICNDIDTASLLIALLRVSGISAHYAYGTIELQIDKAMNWVGGVTDPQMAGTVLATNGIPATSLISGGTITAIQLEHVWVKAFIDYIPSRGAVQRQGNTWIPLDASYKQYTYTQGIDITSAVPFDAQSFANQILSTATTNTTDGSVTNVNSTFVQQTMQNYQTQVQSYIQQNYPNATVGDVIGKKEIIQQNYPILLGTLPYKTLQIGSEFGTIPDNLRETMSFSIPDPTGASAGLTYTTGMPQIAGKKITLSFSPATANDQAVIESLIPTPHADGTPIQPSELPSSFPAYLINLKPELRIDGQVVATGAPGTMGSAQSFAMSLNEPGIGLSNIDNVIKAGEYFGIGVDTGRISTNRLNSQQAKLATTISKLTAQNYEGLTKDDYVGDLLYTTIESYFSDLDLSDEISARTQNVIRYRAPSVGMFSLALDAKDIFGIPSTAGASGMMMDVDRVMQTVFSQDGNMNTVKGFMLTSGAHSSLLESSIPEQFYSTPAYSAQAVSAVKAFKLANDQGIPIYTIDQSNIASILSQIQVSSDTQTDIVNAVNSGKIVTIPKSNITYNGWTGCGYTIVDPTTGAGAYMISGGFNGAAMKCLWVGQFLVSVLVPLPLGLILGMALSVAGSYYIRRTLEPDLPAITGSQIAGMTLDLYVQNILGSVFLEKELVMLPELLALGLPGMAILAFMLVLMVIFDYLVFTYTKLWYEDRNYYAEQSTHIMGVLT